MTSVSIAVLRIVICFSLIEQCIRFIDVLNSKQIYTENIKNVPTNITKSHSNRKDKIQNFGCCISKCQKMIKIVVNRENSFDRVKIMIL